MLDILGHSLPIIISRTEASMYLLVHRFVILFCEVNLWYPSELPFCIGIWVAIKLRPIRPSRYHLHSAGFSRNRESTYESRGFDPIY